MEINLKDEQDAVREYTGGEGVRRGERRRLQALFERMILDEERHTDYLERSCIPSRRWASPTTCRSNCKAANHALPERAQLVFSQRRA